MEEIYKPIKNFETKYNISNFGNIKSLLSNKILKQKTCPTGYLSIGLLGKHYYIHKLVIDTFLNEDKKDVVDHIDGNKKNNNLNNLQYATFSENTINAYNNNENMKKLLTKVNKYDINNNLIKIYNSMAECKKDNNISNSSVINNLSNSNKLLNNCYYKVDKNIKYNKVNFENIIKIKSNEIFKKIELFFDNKFSNYYVSNYGRIYNNKKKIIMKTTKTCNSYYTITLVSDELKTKKIYIHRLVAYLFINKYDTKKVINHIDENKHNNYYKNLEITDIKGNIRHSIAIKINKYDLNMKLIKKYDCMQDAANELKIKQSGNISKCCQGKIKTSSGFIWKYDN